MVNSVDNVETVRTRVLIWVYVGNAMVLFAVAKSPRLRSRTNFFLANLAVADFSVGTFCVIPNLIQFLSLSWGLGQAMCKIYYYVWNVSYTASIVILTVIAVERYIVIIHPLKARRYLTTNKLKAVQGAVWFIAIAYNIPYLILFDTIVIEGIDEEFCYYDGDNINSLKGLSLTNVVVWYCLPLALICYMYYQVALALSNTAVHSALRLQRYPDNAIDQSCCTRSMSTRCSHCHCQQVSKENMKTADIKSTHGSSDQSNYSRGRASSSDSSRTRNQNAIIFVRFRSDGESPEKQQQQNLVLSLSDHMCSNCGVVSQNNSDSFCSKPLLRYRQTQLSSSHRVARSRKNTIRLLIALVLSFAVCVLPHQLKVLNHYWNILNIDHSVDLIISPVSFIVLYLNSVLNPFLYAMFSNHFRRSFKESLYCCRRGRRGARNNN